MDFNIEPYKSVGPLIFGMSRQDVEKTLKHIDRVIVSADGVTELYNHAFDIVVQVATDTNKMIEVGFGRRAKNVTLGKIQCFQQPPRLALSEFCTVDSKALHGLGTILFPNLGISCSGFLNEDDNDQALTAFAQGVWDNMIPKLRPFILQQSEAPHSPEMDKTLKLADKQTKIAPTVELGTTIRTGQVCPQDGIWEATVGGEKLFMRKGEGVPYVRPKLPQTLTQKLAGKFSYGNAEESTWVLSEYRDKSGKPLA
jgi:hypothetical protein